MNEIPDAESERRLSMIRRAIRRTLYTNAALSRRCQEARQRLAKLRYERFILAKRVYGAELHNPRKPRDIEIRNNGNPDDLNGFLSFRRFVSLDQPFQPCWYRCIVSSGPTFSIVYSHNDNEMVFSGSSPFEAHDKLIEKLNERSGGLYQLVSAEQGSAFFGFNQSSISLSPNFHSWLKIDTCLASHISFSFDDFMGGTSFSVSNTMKEEPKATTI